MIPVQEAIDIALKHSPKPRITELPLLDAAGRILAEKSESDVDMPPFEKSSMDGYAVRSKDLSPDGSTTLDVVGTVAAGKLPTTGIATGQAMKIMTGAALPEGADAVQMVEKTESTSDQRVEILEAVASGKNVAHTGEILRDGDELFLPHTYLTSAVIGVLAAVGRSSVAVYAPPEVAVLVTGSELVDIDSKPGSGQIRNSNGYALAAQLRACGCSPKMLGIATDNVEDLRARLVQGLESDLLLITGGVSMGELDFVEQVLVDLGVSIHYEKVNIKPGKPTVFGNKDETMVFGLPGNPVSASTVFEVIVLPLIRKMSGSLKYYNPVMQAQLTESYHNRSRRQTYHPALFKTNAEGVEVTPIVSKGSADIMAFARSNSFVITTAERRDFEAGDRIEVMLRDDFWLNVPDATAG